MALVKEGEFNSKHKTFMLCISYLGVLVIGALDYATGYKLGFSIFYLIPIASVVWYLGLWPGMIISAVSTAVWGLADASARESNPEMFIMIWNTAVRMGFFVTVTVVLAKLKESLEREKALARTDYLTGIANNQAFMEILNEEVQRSNRFRRPLTLAYVDCDQFKAINDGLGHETGNRVLKEVAAAMQKLTRSVDKAGRLGGDEFLLLLPETNSEEAKNVIVRLQQELLKVMIQNNWNVTFSIGVATFTAPLESASEMISQADRLMYCAKKDGKNCVVYQTFSERITL